MVRIGLGLAILFITGRAALAQQFQAECQLPFPSRLALSTDANDACGKFGSETDPTGAHALQNAAKNNLCASGESVEATFVTFKRLQRKIETLGIANWSASHLPPDRSIFHDLRITTNGDLIGEGSVVKLVAYVMKVKKGGKESVNCGQTKVPLIDLHVVLVPRRNAAECESVTAEVIPHFRPTAWTAADISTPDVPMRFTGQLFVDASHKPCANGEPKAGNPARFSIWEIHPVYAIDVCKFTSKSRCDVDDESVWTPLDEWISDEAG